MATIIKAPTEAFDKTSQYINILGFGSMFLVSYNVFGRIFRGLGDSRTPLLAVGIVTVLNIGLDILFVKGFLWELLEQLLLQLVLKLSR